MLRLGGDHSRLVSDEFLAEHFSASYGASNEQQQREAAAALIDHDNGDIFAWLKLARSARRIEPIPEQCPGSAHLSASQIHALFALKDFPNDRLVGWLELARLCRNDPAAMAFTRGPSNCSGLSNNLSSFLEQTDPSSVETNWWTDLIQEDPSQPGITPPSQQSATDDLSGHHLGTSVNSTRSKKAENHYWCTVCEEPNSYKDSGSWKKHEKEHETIFKCGLDDAAANSRAGQSHASKTFTCKRRDIMVNHLNKSHGIIEAHRARDLADQWRHTVKKQAWSCGFCSSLFLTFQDRLRHVDIEHFRRHQHIHEWDLNKVIVGLLQQPKMEKAWKTRTESLAPWVHPEKLAWDKATATKLRATLEEGPSDDHHANTLADEVYIASKANEGTWPQSGKTHGNRHSDATAQASFWSPTGPYQAASALMSGSGSYHWPSPAIADSTARLPSGDASFFEAPTSAFGFGNTVEPLMPSFDDDARVDHNALLVNQSQIQTPASELGTFFKGHEPSQSYGGRAADFSTPDW